MTHLRIFTRFMVASNFSVRLKLITQSTLAIVALLIAATSARAGSITSAADGTGTTIVHNGNVYTIDGGTQAGANLFHSFGEFGLTPQETAHFLSNPSIRNVLGRVVGGNTSTIEGLIRLTGGNSNLFLMNPMGIVFTQGASLDLPGSFAATTATRIGFEGGFFNAYGANNYAALSGDPTNFIFDGNTGSIFNDGTLEVSDGQSIWLVGNSVLNTGTLKAPGGNVTITAVPGGKQLRISQDNMVLNLVLDAVPADGGAVAAPTSLNPTDLPRYLTGGSEVVSANTATIGADGTVYLTSNGSTPAPFQAGDVLIAGPVEAETVQLMAAGQVTPTDPTLVQGDTTVVRFPEQDGDPLALAAIDTTVEDYHNFLFGGTAGTIAFTVESDEAGIAAIGDQLSLIGGAGAKVDAIHIISEGSSGNFWLGSDFVSHENLGLYETQLQAWNTNLTTSADLLLYSCLTALGLPGDSLIYGLADATGADVAASTNITGSAAFGGDWILEKSTGTIEAIPAFTADALSGYQGKLAIFTVTNGGDIGAGTLRQAISDANGLAGADEIRFSGVTLVNLTSAELFINTGDLTITGGTTNVTVQRNAVGNFRIFRVSGVETTFDNLTIRNGQINGSGGAINSNRAVNLSNSTVSGNSSNSNGGGIFTSRELNITNSTVSGNSASASGGGIFTSRELNITNSTISNNTSVGLGGGIYASRAINLTNSTVSGNSSSNVGGGVRGATTIDLNNSTVSGNSSGNQGGGINAGGAVTLTNSTVSGNTSDNRGGGIRTTGTLNLANSIVSGNSSANDGGGMYVSGAIDLSNSTVSNNTSNNRGGGIFARNTLNLANSTVSGNSSTGDGGGVFSLNNPITLTNSTVSGNQSNASGGGIRARRGTIYNSTIAYNTAGTIGGGIFRTSPISTFTIANTIVAKNVATTSDNDLSGTFNTVENSLIGDTAGATITIDTNNLSGVDPLLFALGNYGGSTPTHALRPDSPAINAGSNALAMDAMTMAALSTDQRGASRIFGGTVDIGAFESHGFSLSPVTSPPPVNVNAMVFSPVDVSMQVVESAFSQPVPLEGLSVGYALGTAGVFGSFESTTVVTNSQGIAVNAFNPTGFADGFSGSFEILATPASVAAFVQQVGGGSLMVDTFSGSSASGLSNISRSIDFSAFVGLADLWERRDRTFACATIPDFSLGDGGSQEDGSNGGGGCGSSSAFNTPNRLIDDTLPAASAIAVDEGEGRGAAAVAPREVR